MHRSANIVPRACSYPCADRNPGVSSFLDGPFVSGRLFSFRQTGEAFMNGEVFGNGTAGRVWDDEEESSDQEKLRNRLSVFLAK